MKTKYRELEQYTVPEIECIYIRAEGVLCTSNEIVLEEEGNGGFN